MTIQLFEFQIAGLVQVSGEDALPYLQSQLTIDLKKLPIGGHRLGLRLSLKGRVLFGAQIIRGGEEEFLLICQHTDSETIIGLLEENVVADEVEFSAVPGDWKEAVLYHPTSASEALKLIGVQSLSPGYAAHLGEGWGYFDATLPTGSLSVLMPQNQPVSWAANLPSPHPSELEHLRLLAGRFRPVTEVGKDEFPQEGGLEKTAVDFDKGCYLGQEVMARIHAMGRVRNQAMAVKGAGPLQAQLPVRLLNQGKQVGTLKSQFPLPHTDEWVGAAVIHENAIPLLASEGLQLEGTEHTLQPLHR